MSTGGTLEVGRVGGGQNVLEGWACATEVETIAVAGSHVAYAAVGDRRTRHVRASHHPCFQQAGAAGLVGSLEVHVSQAPSVTAQRFQFHRRNRAAYCCLTWILIICASTTKKKKKSFEKLLLML